MILTIAHFCHIYKRPELARNKSPIYMLWQVDAGDPSTESNCLIIRAPGGYDGAWFVFDGMIYRAPVGPYGYNDITILDMDLLHDWGRLWSASELVEIRCVPECDSALLYEVGKFVASLGG